MEWLRLAKKEGKKAFKEHDIYALLQRKYYFTITIAIYNNIKQLQ